MPMLILKIIDQMKNKSEEQKRRMKAKKKAKNERGKK